MHVLMLGGRPEAVDALRAGGHRITMVYEQRDDERVAGVRAVVPRSAAVSSYMAVDEVVAALRRFGGTPDAVVTLEEFAVLPAAMLGTHLGARALSPTVALRCRDKAVQKAAWRRAGVRTAACVVVPDAVADPLSAPGLVAREGLKGPFVVKPLSSVAGQSVRVAVDERDLVRAIREIAVERPTARALLVEERNEGDEWHFDGFVRDGRVSALLVSRYLTPVIETKNGRPTCTVAFPPGTSRELYARVERFTSAALRALDLTDGVFHLEAFQGPDGFVAGELGARPGGGWIPLMVRTVIGVDLCRAGVQLVTGDPIGVAEGTDEVHGYTHLPADVGRVNRLTARDISAIPGVVRVQLDVPTGSPTPDMRRSSRTRLGLALAKAPDRAACEAVLREVIDTVRRVNTPS